MHTPRLYLLTVLLCLGLLAPAARAEDETAASLQEVLLSPGIPERRWRDIWQKIENAAKPDEMLTGVLRDVIDPEVALLEHDITRENVLPRLTYFVRKVLERNVKSTPLLQAEILARLHSDPELAALVYADVEEDIRSGERAGWQRLREYAQDCLAKLDTDAADGRGVHAQCIWLLATHAGSRRAESVAILKPYAQKAIGSPNKAVKDAFVDAFDSLLSRRWKDLKETVAWLQDPRQAELLKKATGKQEPIDRWRSTIQLLDFVSQVPSEAEKRMIAYAQRHIASVTEPQGLMEYLNREDTPEEAIRVAAINRAAQLKPDATQGAWISLANQVLQDESSPSVMTGLLKIFKDEVSFTTPSPLSPQLVKELIARLQGGRVQDDLKTRSKLIDALTALGTSEDIEQALNDLKFIVQQDGESGQVEIYEKLLRKYGEIDGARARVVSAHYFASADKAGLVAVRKTAAEALGKSAIRKTEAKPAAALLRRLIAGRGEAELTTDLDGLNVPNDFTRENDPAVRAAALGSLQHYPDPETLTLFVSTAAADDAKEAVLAIDCLGWILSRNEAKRAAAADALLGLFAAEKPPADAVLRKALDALASLPAGEGTATTRTKVLAMVRGLLAPDVAVKRAEAVRLAAAAAALALKDAEPNTLEALFAAWDAAEDAESVAAWSAALRAHLEALAVVPQAPHDAVLWDFLQLRRTGTPKQIDEGVVLAQVLNAASDRAQTYYWLGAQLRARAGIEGRDPELVKDDLQNAVAAYTGAISKVPSDDEGARAGRSAWNGKYQTLVQRAGLESDGKAKGNWLLDAAQAALDSKDPDLQAAAVKDDGALGLLEGLGLDEDQISRRNKLKQRLEESPR